MPESKEGLNVLGERLKDLALAKARIVFPIFQKQLDLKPSRALWNLGDLQVQIEFLGLAEHLTIQFRESDLKGMTGFELGEWMEEVRPVPYEDRIDKAIDDFLISSLEKREG